MRFIFLVGFFITSTVFLFAQQKLIGHWRVNGVVKNKVLVNKAVLLNVLEKSRYSVDTSKIKSDSAKKEIGRAHV